MALYLGSNKIGGVRVGVGQSSGGGTNVKTLSGTWRFNDVLTFPPSDYGKGFQFNFSCEAEIQGERYTVFCNSVSLEHLTDNPFYFEWTSYAISGIGEYVDQITVYSSENGWSEHYGGSILQTITFTEEQEVSDEFYEWFTANAAPQKQISGKWTFKDVLSAPSAAVDQELNFIVNTHIPSASVDVAFECSEIELRVTSTFDMYYYVQTSSVDLSALGVTFPHNFAMYVDGWVSASYGEGIKTIDLGTEPQTVSPEFYAWFTANAVRTDSDGYVSYDLSTDNMNHPWLKTRIPRPTEEQRSYFVDDNVVFVPDDVEHIAGIISCTYSTMPIAEGISITPLYFRIGQNNINLYYVWEEDVEIAKMAFASMGVDTSGVTGEGWVIDLNDGTFKTLSEEELYQYGFNRAYWLTIPYGDYFDSLFNFSDYYGSEAADLIYSRSEAFILHTKGTKMDKDIFIRDRGNYPCSFLDENGWSIYDESGVAIDGKIEYDNVCYVNVEVIGNMNGYAHLEGRSWSWDGIFREYGTSIGLNSENKKASCTLSRRYIIGLKLVFEATDTISRVITNAEIVSQSEHEVYLSGVRHDTFIVVILA